MYLKLPAGKGQFTVIPLTDENIFDVCPVCGEEHNVDIDELVTVPGSDFSKHAFCPCCAAIFRKGGLDALMQERKKALSIDLT